jgi:hypothetical protein
MKEKEEKEKEEREKKEKKESEKKEKEEKKEENKEEKKEIKKHGMEEEPKDEKYEVKETVREMNRKRNYTHIPKVKKRFKINEELDVTEINTSSPVVPQNLSFSIEDCTITNSQNIFLFGIDRNDLLHIFDIKKRRWSKKKILEIEKMMKYFFLTNKQLEEEKEKEKKEKEEKEKNERDSNSDEINDNKI